MSKEKEDNNQTVQVQNLFEKLYFSQIILLILLNLKINFKKWIIFSL